MKDSQDAFGHELLDYFQGRNQCEIVERSDGFIDAGPIIYFAEFDAWPSHYKEAMSYVRGRVLDVGCGAGRHALYLQDRGFDVVGIDVSPLAVEVCRLRGLRNALVLSITEVSAGLGRFDTLLMLGNNFGLFGSVTKAGRLLRRFHRVTNEGARIIAESRDPYKTANPAHLEYQAANRERGRMPGQIRIRVRYQRYATPWFDYLFVSQDEMQATLDGTGWRVEHFIDSDSDVAEYIAIIEKAVPPPARRRRVRGAR